MNRSIAALASRHPRVAGAILVSLSLALRVSGPSLADTAYFVLAAFAMLGGAPTILAFATSWLITMLNTGLAVDADPSPAGRYVVLAGAVLGLAVRLVVHRRSARGTTTLRATAALGALYGLHSLFVSSVPDVSLLKSLSWTAVVFVLLATWGGMAHDERLGTWHTLKSGLVAIMLASLPLLALPVGYLRNGRGFQGVLNHPQVFGSTMGLLAVWLVAEWMWLGSALGLLSGLQCMAAFACVLLSESRTAGLAAALSILLAPLMFIASRRQHPHGPSPVGLGRRLGLSVLAIASALAIPTLAEVTTGFLGKRTAATSVMDAYEASRGHLISRMLSNIEERPFLGIGFGIASDPTIMRITRDSWWGIPSSAAVEKGVLPLAVVEETGGLGGLALAAWCVILTSAAFRRGLTAAALCFMVWLSNMGEATLLSAGGMGLLMLVLLTGASAEEVER